jgi:PAS domain S-box-containing protein
MNNRKVFRFVNSAILVGVLFVAFVLIISIVQSQKAAANFTNIELSLKIKDELQKLQMKAVKVQTTTRGYVISGNRGFVDSFPVAAAYISTHLSELRKLVAWDHSQAAIIDSLELNINSRLELSAKIISYMDSGRKKDAEQLVSSEWGKMINTNILKYGGQLEVIDQEMLEKSQSLSREKVHFLNLILYYGIFIFLLLIIFFLVTIWRNIQLNRQHADVINELVGAGPDTMVILNRQGKIIHISSRDENVFGYGLSELKGAPLSTILNITDDEYAAYTLPEDSTQYFSREREVSAIRKDGSVFFAEIYMTPLHGREEFSFAISIRDISKRKAAYRQLEMLSRQINASTDAIYIVDRNRKIVSWNIGAEILYGYSKEEVIGQDPIRIFKVDPESQAVKKVSKWLKENQHWSGETEETTKQGQSIFTFTSITLLTDELGLLDGYISVSYDITDQKRLREELSFHARIVEQTSDAILSTDLKGIIISWNKGAEKLFGYSHHEAIGKNSRQLGLVRFSEEEVASIYAELDEHGKWHAERYYYHKDGHVFAGEVTGNNVINEEGVVTSRAYIVKDISKRKELEEKLKQNNELLEERVRIRTQEIIRTEKRYRILFENNPLPMLLLDLQTSQCIDVNKMAIEKYGYTREEFLTLKAADLRPEDQKANFLRQYEEMREGAASGKGFWLHQKKNGEIFPVECVAHRIKIDYREAWLLMINDITDRRTAEEKLVKSEKKFRTLIENNADIISLMDKDFNVIYRSPSALRYTGWADDEMLGEYSQSKVHPEDREATNVLINQVFKNPGLSFPIRFRHQHKAGHYIWLEGVVVNWLEVEAISAVVFNFRDVSDRIAADEKILANEKRFRESLDHMIEGVQIIGFDWKYIYVNDSMVQQSGLEKDGIIGNEIIKLFPGLKDTELEKGLKKCFEERVSVLLESPIPYSARGSAWFKLSIQPVPEGVFVLTVDITERKKAEEKLIEEQLKLKTLSDNLSGLIIFQIVVEMDDLRFTYISKEAAHFTGSDVSDIINDENVFFDHVSKSDLRILLSSLSDTSAAEKIVENEFVFHSAFDGTRHLKFVGILRQEEASEKVWDGFCIDVTNQKRVEKEIIMMNERLEHLVKQRTAQLTKTNEELEAFSYSVSHDLRAPLRIINGFAEIFEEEYAGKLDEEAQRLTSVIKQNAQRMGQLIDDLLAFFRMGRHEIKKGKFDSNEMITQVISAMHFDGISNVSWKIDRLLTTFGDYTTIRQIWINLISNAVKYTSSKNHPEIEIGSFYEHDETVFYIRDNGVGFDQTYSGKLFKVFQRLHTHLEFEGTGVGLAIVHRIIDRHNGRVWATGKPGEGATFYFSLPEPLEFAGEY